MPTLELVIDPDGRPVWQCTGHGVIVRHQQQAQARLRWHCQATARGYDGPAPVVRP